MEPEALVKLVGSGNSSVVEAEWMRLVESADLTTPALAQYHIVLAEFCRLGKTTQAEALAWAAIEAVQGRESAREALRVAGPFLLSIGESTDLRKQVTEVYKTAYENREGLEALLKEAGLPGGRPVRRALRTLEVALALNVGDFVTSRDDEGAARISAIDSSAWEFTIDFANESETLGAVHLADRFEPALATNFRVLQQFAPKELTARLANDPASIVIDLCKQHGNVIDSEKLESLLVPALLSSADWKKWFSKARTALKEIPNVKIEGRAPYVIHFQDAPRSAEDELLEALKEHRDAPSQVALIDKYLRECKTRKVTPSPETLRQVYEQAREHAKTIKPATAFDAGILWLTARRLGELVGIENAAQGAVAWFKNAGDVGAMLRRLDEEALSELACASFIEARPDTWQSEMLTLLPSLPMETCDRASARLVKSGRGPSDFEPVVQKILSAPVQNFEGLLWLFNGPSGGDSVAQLTPMSLLARILRTLEDCRKADHIPKETVKNINQRARSVLSARRYERFTQCLENMDPGMAATLRVQLRRLDNVGRAVCDELLRLLRDRFPPTETTASTPPWALENVLFVTERGMSRKQSEIEHHVNVKMKENARAIGRAAEHGDLSENSEYKFALEERDLLRARLAQMNAELAKARIIDINDVPTDHVGIGSRVVLNRVSDGLRYEICFVGPWEADAGKGWYNYLAPFSQEMMGKRVGDRVEFSHTGAAGTYEIVEIQNALVEQPAESVA